MLVSSCWPNSRDSFKLSSTRFDLTSLVLLYSLVCCLLTDWPGSVVVLLLLLQLGIAQLPLLVSIRVAVRGGGVFIIKMILIKCIIVVSVGNSVNITK